MLTYLRLIRYKNLLIIASTMYAMRWLVIYPALYNKNLEFNLSEFHFFLLVISTLFIASAGYVINDYFDRKADNINHPENVIVGKKIHRRSAIIIHSIFNLVGVLAGCYVAFAVGHWKYIFIFIGVTGILWFYSTTLKRKLLIGNITIAFITAMVPFMVFLFEFPGFYLHSKYTADQLEVMYFIMLIILGFSFFAFITSVLREIVKDIEDIRGDIRMGCRSIPIAWGVKAAASISFGLIVLIIVSIFTVYCFYLREQILILNHTLTLVYLIFLEALLLVSLFLLSYAREKKHYRRLSIIIKLIMFFGVSFSGVFYLSLI